MPASVQTTHRDEQYWRLFIALLGAGTFALLTSTLATAPSLFQAVAFSILMMTAIWLVYTSLSQHVWKYWWTAFFEILAVDLAICAAWVYVEGVPGVPSMPPTLWPFFALVLSFLAGTLAVFSGFLRVTKTVEPGQSYDGTWGACFGKDFFPTQWEGVPSLRSREVKSRRQSSFWCS